MKCHRVHGVAAAVGKASEGVTEAEKEQEEERGVGLSAHRTHMDRHINFAARSRDRMQFFFNLAAIAFQWQEVNARGERGAGSELG